MTLVSIDPGLRGCGVARFEGGTLTEAGYVRNPEAFARGPVAWREMAHAVRVSEMAWFADTVAIEMMRIYSERQQKGSQEDILELVGVVSAVATLLPRPIRVTLFTASQWKGGVPKAAHNKRVLAKLSATESACLEDLDLPSSLEHNVIDAIGIGLYALGRLKGGSALARLPRLPD